MVTGFHLIDYPNTAYAQCRPTRRNGATVSGGIILHSAENPTDLDGPDGGAESVARYLSTRTTPGSYHTLTDRDSIIRCAPYEYETWHDTTSNNYTVGISVAWRKADLPRMTYAQRRSYYIPFARAVLHAVAWFRARGIDVPLGRFLTREEIVARRPGISTHSRMDPSRRTDPFGTGSPYEGEFLAVLSELATPEPPEPPAPPRPKVRPMRLLKSPDSPRVYLTDGMTRRHVTNPAELGEVQAILRSVDVRDDVGEISAATLAAIPLAGAAPVVDAGEIRAAVTAALAGVTVDVDEDAIVAGIASRLPTRVTLAGALEAGA